MGFIPADARWYLAEIVLEAPREALRNLQTIGRCPLWRAACFGKCGRGHARVDARHGWFDTPFGICGGF